MKKINHLVILFVFISSLNSVKAQNLYWETIGNIFGDDKCTSAKLGTQNYCPLRFFTNNTFRSVITETGEFGFGIAQPKNMFHIHQSDSYSINMWEQYQVNGVVGFRKDSAGNSRGGGVMLNIPSETLLDSDGSSTKLSTFPFAKEEPIFSGYSKASILLTNAITGATADDGLKIEIYNNNATFHLQESGDMVFKNKTTTSFQLNSSGNFYIKNDYDYPFYYKKSTNRIGIGTSSPVALFHVNGDSYFDGNIGVGTTTTHGYKVAVRGKILCEEVVCKNSAYWPDYVYQPNYKIKTIKELSIFVKKFGHLPGMPSAAEIEETGLNLVEVSRATVEKVEESSLYIIELDEHIDELQCEIETQKVQINAQKVQIEEQDRKIEEQNQKIENLERLVKEFMSNNKNSNNEK